MTKIKEYNPMVGQTWVSRDGVKYTIVSVNTAGDQPVLAVDPKKRMIRFTREGFFISKSFLHDSDLMEQL